MPQAAYAPRPIQPAHARRTRTIPINYTADALLAALATIDARVDRLHKAAGRRADQATRITLLRSRKLAARFREVAGAVALPEGGTITLLVTPSELEALTEG